MADRHSARADLFLYIYVRSVPATESPPTASELKMDAQVRGYDRRPTEAEFHAPPDKRPWTEYDFRGAKQPRPPFKGASCGPGCCCCGPTCCILEVQWCEACGPDADQCCDVCLRCRWGQMPCCICFGPQCNDLTPDCCQRSCCCCCCGQGFQEWSANNEMRRQERCESDCIENNCASGQLERRPSTSPCL